MSNCPTVQRRAFRGAPAARDGACLARLPLRNSSCMRPSSGSGSRSAWPAPKSTLQCCAICSGSSSAARSSALRLLRGHRLRRSAGACDWRPRPDAFVRSVVRQRNVCPPTVTLSMTAPTARGCEGRVFGPPFGPYFLPCLCRTVKSRPAGFERFRLRTGSKSVKPSERLLPRMSESPVDELRRTGGGDAGAGAGDFCGASRGSGAVAWIRVCWLSARFRSVFRFIPRPNPARFASRYMTETRERGGRIGWKATPVAKTPDFDKKRCGVILSFYLGRLLRRHIPPCRLLHTQIRGCSYYPLARTSCSFVV